MTRAPRYIAVPQEPLRGPIVRPVDRAHVVGGKTRGGAVPNVDPVFIEQQHRAQHAVGLLLDEADQRSSTSGSGAAGGDHLEHLVLRRAKRLLAAPFGDVARDGQQLDDGAVRVGDRRHDDVPPLRVMPDASQQSTLKTAAPATARRGNRLLAPLANLALEKLVDWPIQQRAGMSGISSSFSPSGLI